MPLNEHNQRGFHRGLYAGQLQTVTMLKAGDNQLQGQVTTHKLFDCRWSAIAKRGETYDGDMTSDHYRQLHIPRVELDRIGVNYLNPPDTFVDRSGRTWINESTEPIDIKLFEVHVCINTRRLVN